MFRGIRGVGADWEGTLRGFGSRTPLRALEATFAGFGFKPAHLLVGLGCPKREHITRIFKQEYVRERWFNRTRAYPTKRDEEDMYQVYVEELRKRIKNSEAIPGVKEALMRLHKRGIRVGATTGYTADLVNLIYEMDPEFAEYVPITIASGEIIPGRPYPYQFIYLSEQMGVPLHEMCKIGDTPADMQEGKSAGVFTIGVSWTGVGRDGDKRKAEKELYDAGADIVIPSFANLPELLDY